LANRTLINIVKDVQSRVFLVVREDTQEEIDRVLSEAHRIAELESFGTIVICVYGSEDVTLSFYSKLEPQLMTLPCFDLYMDDPDEIEVTHLLSVEDLMMGVLLTNDPSEESMN
jgi:hypothetical protein